MTTLKSPWQFLNKTNDPRLSMLRKFAAAVGCSVKSLFEEGTMARIWGSHENRGLVVALQGSAILILCLSYFHTPMASGAPASGGNIIQPLVWFAALLETFLAAIITLTLCLLIGDHRRRGLSFGRQAKAARVIALYSLLINCGQLLFALVGPNL